MKKLLLLATLIAFASVPYAVEAKGHHKHYHNAKKKHHKAETETVASEKPHVSACDVFYPGQVFQMKLMFGLEPVTVMNVDSEKGLVTVKYDNAGLKETNRGYCYQWKEKIWKL